jgi:hypothetical protein
MPPLRIMGLYLLLCTMIRASQSAKLLKCDCGSQINIEEGLDLS